MRKLINDFFYKNRDLSTTNDQAGFLWSGLFWTTVLTSIHASLEHDQNIKSDNIYILPDIWTSEQKPVRVLRTESSETNICRSDIL